MQSEENDEEASKKEEVSEKDVTKYKKQYVFCDESGTHGKSAYFGFGALFLDHNRRGDHAREWTKILEKHRLTKEEVKWSGINKKKVHLAKDAVDYFFKYPWLRFACIRIAKQHLSQAKRDGETPEGYRHKRYTTFLRDKFNKFASASEPTTYEVKMDKLSNSYGKTDEVIKIICENDLKKLRLPHTINLKEVDSKLYTGVQLCDLLLGAAIKAAAGDISSQYKKAVIAHIEQHLGPGTADLRCDTYPSVWKYNIWHYFPENHEREVDTMSVSKKWTKK